MANNYKGYTFFYTNGCSWTKGGGLEEPNIRPGWPVITKYKEKYNVDWNQRDQVNWPTRLSELLQIQVINEAECGGSAFRAIRMAYDFVLKNLKQKDNFFVLLEIPNYARIDLYSNELQQHMIVNVRPEYQNKKLKVVGAATSYYSGLSLINLSDYQIYVDKHYNLEEAEKEYYKTLLGFYFFCKYNGVLLKYLYEPHHPKTHDYHYHYEYFIEDCYIGPFEYSIKHKCCINDEIDGVDDGHPGYFGHIKYANYLKLVLDKTIKRPL
jgi:hypothetical protein